MAELLRNSEPMSQGRATQFIRVNGAAYHPKLLAEHLVHFDTLDRGFALILGSG